ncbi:hypothetical protein E4U31_003935 [Claviceps sp. LM219 group G6]|nr:hypothetical protein E4U31_003935 [Claviceps sp. LM219 group G6]
MVPMRWSAVEYFCSWASDSDELPESCSDRSRFLQPEPPGSDTRLLAHYGQAGKEVKTKTKEGGKKSKSVEKNQTERFFVSRHCF